MRIARCKTKKISMPALVKTILIMEGGLESALVEENNKVTSDSEVYPCNATKTN
jgi:23S rRNA maturation-related 3'-5' exoribonuclease YhaM